MIVFFVLGGVFFDVYDLIMFFYGIDDVVCEFQFLLLLIGLVILFIMVGIIVGNIIGGWLIDKYGCYLVFMVDMFFFVILVIVVGLVLNVWVLIGVCFLMGIGVGIDLLVVMFYLVEFFCFVGKGNKVVCFVVWCLMWYVVLIVCFFIIFGFYFLLLQEYFDWLWCVFLLFGVVLVLLIIVVCS